MKTNNIDIKYLNMAIDLAAENVEKGGGPFGAVIVRDDKLITTGVNNVTDENDPTAHAEIQAIRKAAKQLNSFKLENCTLYSSCEPCPMCLGAIYWSGISRLVFASSKKAAEEAGFMDAHIYNEMELNYEERDLSTRYLNIDGAGKEFKRWMDKGDKIEY